MVRRWTRILLICADEPLGVDVDVNVDVHADVIGFFIWFRPPPRTYPL